MPHLILEAIILVVLVLLLYKTLPAYAAKKGENRANAEDGRKIAYEEEKGRNLATKEDIDTIIKELEKVKAEVSLIEQRKHNLIEKRNENLLGVVQAAEKTRIMRIKLSSVINNRDAKRLSVLTDEISEILVSLRNNVQIVTALTVNEEELDPLNLFSYDILRVCTKFIEHATNAISLIDNYNELMEKAEKTSDFTYIKKCTNRAYENLESIHKLVDEILNTSSKENWTKHEEKYIEYLNKSFKVDKLIAYK